MTTAETAPGASPSRAANGSCRSPAGATAHELILTPVSGADIAELYALHADPALFRHDSTEPLTELEQMRRVLASWMTHREQHGFGHVTVRAADDPDGSVLGVCGASRMRLTGRDVISLYYRFSTKAQGRGVARTAVRALLADLRTLLGDEEDIVVATDPDNQPSIRLAESLGLRRTGGVHPTRKAELIVLAGSLADIGVEHGSEAT
ncbi:MAG: GNAT family N-acetyltransferase [Brachybacterium sp.]|nr:GNAT family N-acetyltransferase [Brachybacterium sp.]